MAVYFHGSFGLNRRVLSKVKTLAFEKPSLRDQDLASPFGYGAPFAAKHRSWLHKVGLAEMGLPLQLTEKGTLVFKRDPELESMTTQWFIHHELTDDPTRAEAWHFFAKEFLPQRESFTREDLLVGLEEKLRSHSEKHFGPGSKLNKVIAAKLLECYTKDHGLGALGLLEQDGKQFIRGTVQPMGPWDSIEELRSAYREHRG